jgi:hypothetical protein
VVLEEQQIPAVTQLAVEAMLLLIVIMLPKELRIGGRVVVDAGLTLPPTERTAALALSSLKYLTT